MSNIGLLESVRKYRPRQGTDPLENFITEAFAWMLNDCPEFGAYFVTRILENQVLPNFDTNHIRWETQINFDGVFPDMVCRSKEAVLVFEHKAWSEVHSNQISNYRNYAIKTYTDSLVILITANSQQHIHDADQANTPDRQLLWSDVYTHIKIWCKEKGSTPFILDEFMKLIDSVGMGPSAPVSQDSIRYYYLTAEIKNNIGTLLKNVEHRDWLAGYEKCQRIDTANRRGYEYGEQNGRMSIDFRLSSHVRLCIGFALDGGRDLGVAPLNKNLGPDMTMVLIMDREVHGRYTSLPEFNELKYNLKKKTDHGTGGWQFYDNTADPAPIRINNWTPIQIRKPMFDVFCGTSDAESQADTFFKNGKHLINLLLEEPCLWEMCEKLDSNESKAA